MTGKPMLFRDLDRLRPHLTVSAFERVRVSFGAGDGKLRLDLECVACEELLEWDLSKGWWVCPSCRQEVTDREGADLLWACYEGLGEVLDDGRSKDPERGATEESGGVGRWVRRMLLG